MQTATHTTTKLPGRGTANRHAQAVNRWQRRIAQRHLQAAGQHTQAALATADATSAATLRGQARQALALADAACAAAQQALDAYRANRRLRAAQNAQALLPAVPATLANMGVRAALMAKAAMAGAHKAQAAKTATAQPGAKQTAPKGSGAGAQGLQATLLAALRRLGGQRTTAELMGAAGIPTGPHKYAAPRAALQALAAQGKVTGVKGAAGWAWQLVG